MPEVSAAVEKAFGEGGAATATAEAPPATRRQTARKAEESAEELEGLEGATHLDDGIEPQDGQPKIEQQAAAQPAKPDATAQQAAEEELSTLSPVLRQAAKRAGWKDSDIDELHKQNPEMAETAFNQMLKSLNDLSAEYGRLGNQPLTQPDGSPMPQHTQAQPFAPQMIPQQNQPQPPANQMVQQQQQVDLMGQLYGQNGVAALSEKYGADFMTDIVQPMLAPVQEMIQYVEQQQTQVMADQVNGYFNSLDDGFTDIYGKKDEVSKEQGQNKLHVALMADQIRTGARRQGVDLPVGECLGRANLMFAAEHLGLLERKKITQQVQKRSKQLTQRPSQRNTVRATSERSYESAADALGQRAHELGLEELFGSD